MVFPITKPKYYTGILKHHTYMSIRVTHIVNHRRTSTTPVTSKINFTANVILFHILPRSVYTCILIYVKGCSLLETNVLLLYVKNIFFKIPICSPKNRFDFAISSFGHSLFRLLVILV